MKNTKNIKSTGFEKWGVKLDQARWQLPPALAVLHSVLVSAEAAASYRLGEVDLSLRVRGGAVVAHQTSSIE
jgi:hypothetical protein